MHRLLKIYLAFLARTLIRIKKPSIIGVTGTAGKTTISRFVSVFLTEEFGEENVGFSRYNYNGEYGLPLTIIGAKTGGKNILKWIWVFFVFLSRFFQKYPKYLVLEYGIDHIGEMDFLLSVAVPDIAIISPIVENHMEQFGTIEHYRNEKLKILAAKHALVHESLYDFISKEYRKKVVFYGSGHREISAIFAEKITENTSGVAVEVSRNSEKCSLTIPMVGGYQAENILPLFGISDILWVDAKKIEKIEKKFFVRDGRSALFDGIHDSKIIDGSYNGGFLSMIEGMKSTLVFAPEYTIFVFLGDMRELGDFEKEKHEELANEAIKIFQWVKNVEFFLCGKSMKKYTFPILEKKFSTICDLSSRKLWKIIKQKMSSSDEKVLVYVKWSQNTIFLEEGIKEFLDKRYHIFLCRQWKNWSEKKKKFFESVE